MLSDFHDKMPAHTGTGEQNNSRSRSFPEPGQGQGVRRDLQHRFEPSRFTPEQRLMWLSQAVRFITVCRGLARR